MKHALKGNAERQVWLNGEWLDLKTSQKVYNHSPDGFNWGYGGSGPAQLALAIMLKLTDKSDGYQDFKWAVIAKLPDGPFETTFELDIERTDWKEWARSQKAEVHEAAEPYSGGFVKAMVEAFQHADSGNTEKLLNTFPEYFKQLHRIHLTAKEKEGQVGKEKV